MQIGTGKAASALFDKLDRDHDGTLDKRELARRLTPKEFAAADPDHDGTLTKDEYLVNRVRVWVRLECR